MSCRRRGAIMRPAQYVSLTVRLAECIKAAEDPPNQEEFERWRCQELARMAQGIGTGPQLPLDLKVTQ